MNVVGRPGRVGRMRRGQVVVRCDPATGELIRGEDGFCERPGPGESGLLIGKITAVAKFDGYVDEEATRKKILHDVFVSGDRYFNSGDLVDLHEDRWISFADRIGDTFRWKGENVSTNEVAEILNGAEGVLEANVYGVRVPHCEGRAGMVALRTSEGFDLERFATFAADKLPGYQRPHFVRLLREMRTTATFKHQKGDYREGRLRPLPGRGSDVPAAGRALRPDRRRSLRRARAGLDPDVRRRGATARGAQRVRGAPRRLAVRHAPTI